MFSLSQVVSTPTHTAPSGEMSLIDLVVVSNPALVLDCYTIPALERTDVRSYHKGLKLILKWKHSNRQVQQHPRTVWRYANADFRMASQMIEEVDWDSLLPEDDIDLAANNRPFPARGKYAQNSISGRSNYFRYVLG